MQITETNTQGLKREYNVVIAASEIDRKLETRLGELAKDMRLPGFRPGKVPVAIVKKRYGASVMGEVLEKAVNDSSAEAIRQHQLRPALQPKVEIKSFSEGSDLVFEMTLEILPEIEEIDLSTIELERLKPEIADSEVDQALERLAERYRKSETVEDGSPAQQGDIVIIDAKGYESGKQFEGGTIEGFELELGSGQFIPGFEEQLIGAKAGDHVTVNVTFPAEYQAEELKGKEAIFEVDLKELKRKKLAAVDESLAEQLGMEGLDELRQTLREQIERDYAAGARQKMKRELLDILAERYKFDVPTGMVDLEFDGIWKQFEEEKKRATEAGTFIEPAAEEEEKTKAEYRDIAERRVRLGLLLAEIGRLNNVQVTQDELNRAVAAEARRYPNQFKEVLDYYKGNPEAVNMLRAPILEEKVVDIVFEKAHVTDKPVAAEELRALLEAEEADDEIETPSSAATQDVRTAETTDAETVETPEAVESGDKL